MSILSQQLIAGLLGLVVTNLLGLLVRPILPPFRDLKKALPISYNSSELFSAIDATQLVGLRQNLLGCLERNIFFGAMASGLPLAIGGLLAFKLASKWQTWQHIVRIPASIHGISELDYLRLKNCWGSLLSQRFTLGTFANIIAAALGWFAYQAILRAEFVLLYRV